MLCRRLLTARQAFCGHVSFRGIFISVSDNKMTNPILPTVLVFVGCCSNLVFLEHLVSEFPGCGNLITFCQFLFIAIEGLVSTSKFFTVKPQIPLRSYVTMVSYFFLVQVVSNIAFSFNVSVPLQMIFRAGSMIASLSLGRILLKRKYSRAKYISVITITIGIAAATISSASFVKHIPKEGESPSASEEKRNMYDLFIWIFGVVMLALAVFLTAGMGIFQERTYAKFGKHPRESLFYNHFLPLPGFLFLMSDIVHHVSLFNTTPPVELAFGIAVPKIWLFLAGNIVTQYVCIRSVFVLTTECSALTVTLIVTLRKFVSIIVSVIYFKNPFTPLHWFGTTLVFIGTLIFSEIIKIPGLSEKKKEDKKEKEN